MKGSKLYLDGAQQNALGEAFESSLATSSLIITSVTQDNVVPSAEKIQEALRKDLERETISKKEINRIVGAIHNIIYPGQEKERIIKSAVQTIKDTIQEILREEA